MFQMFGEIGEIEILYFRLLNLNNKYLSPDLVFEAKSKGYMFELIIAGYLDNMTNSAFVWLLDK